MNDETRLCPVGEVQLCYDTVGDPGAQPIVLVMGLGLPMWFWREEFCRGLAERGFRVVRFDNRDCGRSTKLTGRGVTAGQFLTRRARPAYTLADMADDVAGLITHLDCEGSHIVGASLGALIAQETAIRHPRLVGSLTSIMGRTGDGRNGRVARSMIPLFLRRSPRTPEAAVEDMVRAFRRIGSAGRTADDDADVRATMRRALEWETGDGSGSGRQLAAVIAERDRTADLRRLRMPCLVVHGERDRVITPSGGRATAAAVPGAELLMIAGMGHDLPRWTWPVLIDGIARTTRRPIPTA